MLRGKKLSLIMAVTFIFVLQSTIVSFARERKNPIKERTHATKVEPPGVLNLGGGEPPFIAEVTPDSLTLENAVEGKWEVEFVGRRFQPPEFMDISAQAKFQDGSSREIIANDFTFINSTRVRLEFNTFTDNARVHFKFVTIAGESNRVTVGVIGNPIAISGGGGGNPEDGETVAVIGLPKPEVNDYVVCANIPIPKNIFPRQDGLMPFAVKDHDGSIREAQVEALTYYPNINDGASIVHLCSHVSRDINESSDFVQYEVIQSAHPLSINTNLTETTEVLGEIHNLPVSVKNELLQPGKILMFSKNMDGDHYRLDLLAGESEIKNFGGFKNTVRTHGTLIPVNPSGNANPPHLMGVHAYLSTRSGFEGIEVAMRLHNGVNGLDPNTTADDALENLYFEDLRLRIPEGWSYIQDIEDPYFDPNPTIVDGMKQYKIIKKLNGNDLHYMRRLAATIRLGVIVKDGTANTQRGQAILDLEGLAFAMNEDSEHYGWWNAATAAWYPQKDALPHLNHLNMNAVRNQLTNRFNYTRNIIETGQGDGNMFQFNALGWAMPMGVQYGGGTGGVRIRTKEGLQEVTSQSYEGVKHYWDVYKSKLERHPTALWNKDGSHTQLSQLLHECNNIPGQYGHDIQYHGAIVALQTELNNPFGFGNPAYDQDAAVQSQGRLPFYFNTLDAYYRIDFQHYIRFTRAPKALVYLTGHPMLVDALRNHAFIIRMANTNLRRYDPNTGNCNDPSGSLRSNFVSATNTPNRANGPGRATGHRADALSLAYATTSDPVERAEMQAWAKMVVDWTRLTQIDCSGHFMSVSNSNFPVSGWIRQLYEVGFVEQSLTSMNESIFRNVDPDAMHTAYEVLKYSSLGNITIPIWSVLDNAPNEWVRVIDANNNPICPADLSPSEVALGYSDGTVTTLMHGITNPLTPNPEDFVTRLQQFYGGNILTGAQNGIGALPDDDDDQHYTSLRKAQEMNGDFD